MKRSVFLFLFAPVLCLAQNRISVKEEVVAIEDYSRNSLTVQVDGAVADDIKKEWKKKLKDLGGKVNDKTVIFGDDCQDKSMGDNSFDVYSLVDELTDGIVRVVVAFDLGGAYLNSTDHPDKFPAAEKLVRDFAVEQSKNLVKSEIESSEKILKALEKNQSGLEKDKEKLQKDIKDYEGKIEENKASIVKNTSDQTSRQKEVHRLEGTQVDGQIEEVQNLIKGFKKEMDGLAKDNKRLEKDNGNLAEKIKESKADIEQNLKDQSKKKAEIEGLKPVIKDLEVKLNIIN